ncbi:hypothetical protein Pan216_15480 [Planctomycetes bacterium Pan216]|uniref:Alginate lyase n=1 Tax=Kolteria novifilia TaxID=2527975 RepID=A0A518B151_9BACT|nr:hypothetical protein Pan216_15480 [Planctomycetes bacterium Pan216]
MSAFLTPRRRFLQCLSAASVYGCLPAWSVLADQGPSNKSLHESAETFQRFVENSLNDSDGLVRSFFNLETGQPFTNAALGEVSWKARLTDFFQNSPDPAACLTYENAIMATGEYALSQMSRWRVTKSDVALANAKRAIAAMLRVVDEGRHYMPGYLPKPLGGLSRARYSQEMSVDQYTKAIAAFYAWYLMPESSTNDPVGREEIARFLVDAADFFIARKFRHAYRHRTIVTAPTHLHCLGLYVSLPWLAAKLTGERSYLKYLKKFEEPMARVTTDENLTGFNQASLVIEGFHTAIEAGAPRTPLATLMKELWNRSAQAIRSDGTGIQMDKPSSQSTRLAAVVTLVPQFLPTNANNERPAERPIPTSFSEQIELSRRTLGRLTGVSQMVNPRLPGTISSTSITSWLLAYWRLRGIGAISG